MQPLDDLVVVDLTRALLGPCCTMMLADPGARVLPAGPIYQMSEVMADPQVRHREVVVELEHPRAGRIAVNGVPVKLSATPGAVRTPPPVLGDHTEGVLRDLGLSADEIAALREERVV